MNINLVGAGRIAKFHHDAFKKAGAKISAVCTRGESGKIFSENNNLKYFSDVNEMIDSQNPDGICILTQPSSYLQLLKLIKKKNIPVILEKPVSYTYLEGLELRKLLPDKVMVAQNRRFYSNVYKVKKLIRNIPELTAHFFVCERAKDFQIRNQIDRDNWHTLNTIHGVDLMKYLFGSPDQKISSERWGSLEFSRLPAFVNFNYMSNLGHKVHFHSNLDSPGGWRIHIFYKETEITFSPIEKTIIKTYQGIEEIQNDPLDSEFKQGFVAQAKCFINGCQSDSLPKDWVSYDDALDSVELTEKIYGTL
jgi:predicted dehydrogenase